ncbi:hypothetical protein ACWD0Z_06835 [Streptomyces sp. NPDC003007]
MTIITQQSAPTRGAATPGTLFLSLVPATGLRDTLVTTSLVHLGGVVPTGLLSLRPPRTVVPGLSRPDNSHPGKPR